MKFEGKTILVTGGARGLGKGFAEAALEAGAKGVVLVDMNAEAGYKTAMEFSSIYGNKKAIFLRCDITDKQQLESTFQKAVQALGYLDIVVNNAGIATNGDNFELVIDVNLTALTRCNYLAVDHMRQDGSGKGGLIVNISSTAGLTVIPFEPVYAASKHGVVGLTRSLAVMVKPQGIKVTCLCPSFTRTELLATTEQDLELKQLVEDAGIMEIADVVKAFVKLVEDEVAGAVMSVTPQNGIIYVYPRRMRQQAKI